MNFFNKNKNKDKDTTPEWVKGVCVFLEIQEIPECKDWGVVNSCILMVIMSEFPGQYIEDHWVNLRNGSSLLTTRSFLARVFMTVATKKYKKESSIENNLFNVGLEYSRLRGNFRNKFYEAVNYGNTRD
jgi:hypothetical protein